MTPQVTLRLRARVDLLEQFAWFGEESGVERAERYLAAVEETCSLLTTQPLMGALYESGVPELKDMRRFRVKGFENHLIFYGKTDFGIEIVRILHGARDLDNLFANEEDQPSGWCRSKPKRQVPFAEGGSNRRSFGIAQESINA